MNNIYLIGMPGCGKSTIGEMLSFRLGMQHIDADKYLEKKYGMTIPEIFAQKGEDDFREKETAVIEELSRKKKKIISTGGGVVKFDRNRGYMKDTGIIIFIDTKPDDIISNSSLGGRPLLNDKSNLYRLYDERIEKYRAFADVSIDNNDDIESAVNKIISCI